MPSIIAQDTFEVLPQESQPDHGFWIEGTVEVTLRNETRRVSAYKSTRDESVTARGMTGRYLTGTKAWPAEVQQRVTPEGKVWDFVSFGRDDRSGKFQKTNALSFA